MHFDAANKAIKDTQSKLVQLWNENPVLCIVLGIATANAGARVMQANTDRKRRKDWTREVTRREKNDRHR